MAARPPFSDSRVRDTIVLLAKRSFARRYLEEYRRLNPGVESREVEAWMLPVAAARLREGIEPERGFLVAYVRERLR
jgi:hypothetical protein